MGTLLTYLCSMLTRYYIEIDGAKAEVPKGCLKNWDEIKCVYKRSDFSGVTRSFTTQFEFVGEIYDRLMALYLRDGINAHAVLSLYVITSEWEWEKQFSCDLDFSSITWDNYAVKLNCIDNSLAALIKSKKGTKYESVINTDVKSDCVFAFNRLTVENSITYEYTGGASSDTDGSLCISAPQNDRVYMGLVNGGDVAVNGAIAWEEDQTEDSNSYMLEAFGNTKVHLVIETDSDRCFPDLLAPAVGNESNDEGASYKTEFKICIYHSDGTSEAKVGYDFGSDDKRFCGTYPSADALKAEYPHNRIVVNGKLKTNYWALVNGIVWEVKYLGSAAMTNWESTGQTEAQYRRKHKGMTIDLELTAGDKVAIATTGSPAKLYSSKFTFSWKTKGNPLSVSAFTPVCLGQHILNNMCSGHTNTLIEISDHDLRLKSTVVVAAESIRGIPTAKIYTSFDDFCDWMETVFGYTYYLGKRTESVLKARKNVYGGFASNSYPIASESWKVNNTAPPTENNIIYFSNYGKFLAFDGNKWYADFPGASDYNDVSTGQARTDTVFLVRKVVNNEATYTNYYFINGNDGELNREPIVFRGNIEDISRPFQSVVFVHRSEIFSPQAPIRRLTNAKDLEYTVESGQIYSTINIGYDKKDYQNTNGRDEFNFSNTYSTGALSGDKKLILKSKYRADCYGIEFAAQKRGKDTTDTTSDNDVFFAYCAINDNGTYTPDTSAEIEGAISDDVFNGVFSPMACIEANAGYIGMQSSNPLKLEFASADGNSDIVIDGRPINSALELTTPLMTCGTVQFSSADVDTKLDVNALYEVQSNGITYRGFLKEVSFKYAKAETVKYKLIVKEIAL